MSRCWVQSAERLLFPGRSCSGRAVLRDGAGRRGLPGSWCRWGPRAQQALDPTARGSVENASTPAFSCFQDASVPTRRQRSLDSYCSISVPEI